MQKKIKIMLADDEKFILESMTTFLEIASDIKMEKRVTDAEGVLKLIRNGNYDLIIMDLSIPKKKGFEVLDCLKIEEIKTQVLVFTNYCKSRDVLIVTKLGKYGFICKQEPPENLADKLKTILSGDRCFDIPINPDGVLYRKIFNN